MATTHSASSSPQVAGPCTPEPVAFEDFIRSIAPASQASLPTAITSAESIASPSKEIPSVETYQTGREFKTEASAAIKKDPSTAAVAQRAVCGIPEKDSFLWSVTDFTAFRKAAKVSKLPALISPEFGNGCRLHLSLFDRGGHISGHLELPAEKATRDGVSHFTVAVLRPDGRPICERKVEMRAYSRKEKNQQPKVPTFRLSIPRLMRKPKWEHLAPGDIMKIRVELLYFPFDAAVFSGSNTRHEHSRGTENLLADIRNFCGEDSSQMVEIRVTGRAFHSCRFLLCARSTRFRNMLAPSSNGASRLKSVSASSSPCAVSLDVDPDIMDSMLSYIHTDHCELLDEHLKGQLAKQLQLLETANAYGVDSLTAALVKVLCNQVNGDNFMQLFEVAEATGLTTLSKACTDFMDSLPGSKVALIIKSSVH